MVALGARDGSHILDNMWIDDTFPNLDKADYKVTSEPTETYNCVAWALGVDTEWWSHLPGYRWTASRTPDVASLVQVFVNMRFEQCDNQEPEDGYEKVSIFAKDGRWTHVTRQLENGRWTSKLGTLEDVEHAAAESLTGDFYGNIHCTMRRFKDG